MKLKSKKLPGETNAFATMPSILRDKISGMTMNEAIAAGHITHLGDDTGRFIFPHATNDNLAYAIVQGYTLPCSKGLTDKTQEEVLEIVGDLRFQKGVSNIEGDGFGKEWFRLTLPAYVNLGAEANVTLGAELVEA